MAAQQQSEVRVSVLWGIFAGAVSALMWVLAIPPCEFAEAAYVAFVPLLLWFATRPSWKASVLVSLATAFCSWCAILIWLRHVTVFGTLALAAIQALIYLPWLVLARWMQPAAADTIFLLRMLIFAGLAGAWVVLEWARTWLFWGFPWAPLALSQWQRPVVLQLAAWTGAYGVSFMLLFLIAVSRRPCGVARRRGRGMWTGWFSPDLYVGMGLLAACMWFRTLPRATPRWNCLLRVWCSRIPAELKWDEGRALEHLKVLEQLTYYVGRPSVTSFSGRKRRRPGRLWAVATCLCGCRT